MPATVVDIGNCTADHQAIQHALQQHFDAALVQAHTWEDAASKLQDPTVELVLVNRVLDRDGSDGLQLIRRLKADPRFAQLPVMLVSNYPEYQQRAIQAGAEPGFGKAELGSGVVAERLGGVLARR